MSYDEDDGFDDGFKMDDGLDDEEFLGTEVVAEEFEDEDPDSRFT